MYAIVETGSKQLKVKVGDLLTTEKLEGAKADEVVLTKVLMISDETTTPQVGTFGNPYLENAQVLCEIVSQSKAPKITLFKYKRRKGYRRKKGHRQEHTFLKVKEISLTRPAYAGTPTAKAAQSKTLVETSSKSAVPKSPASKIAAKTIKSSKKETTPRVVKKVKSPKKD